MTAHNSYNATRIHSLYFDSLWYAIKELVGKRPGGMPKPTLNFSRKDRCVELEKINLKLADYGYKLSVATPETQQILLVSSLNDVGDRTCSHCTVDRNGNPVWNPGAQTLNTPYSIIAARYSLDRI